MIVDSSVLLAAVDEAHPSHGWIRSWWERQLSGARRVGLPWPSVLAFLATSTDPTACHKPLNSADAAALVNDWLRAAPVWIPLPTERHAEVVVGLLTRYACSGPALARVDLAALAIQHGGPVFSTEPGYSRFREIEVINPRGQAAQRW